jgi:proteasome assembly chaperone (PAC2) family protein
MAELAWSPTATSGPPPVRPILTLAWRGFFDAGAAATSACAAAVAAGAEALASIDPEAFFDFSKERPRVVIDGDERRIVWPANEFVLVRTGGRHDLVVCRGVEPHLRWATFAGLVVGVAERVRAELVVTLGALPALVPHSRAVPVTASTQDRALAARLGLDPPSYQGPTGVVGPLHDLLARRGVPAVSLRAMVPHYVAGADNPKAAMALLERLEHVCGTALGASALTTASIEWEARVEAAVVADPAARAHVRQLERQHDAARPLPTGDQLAAELEAFLRDEGDEPES